MRKFTTLIVLAILAMGSLMAQAPQKFTYQAVVRNTNNQLLPNYENNNVSSEMKRIAEHFV